jgi:hypothetical protein
MPLVFFVLQGHSKAHPAETKDQRHENRDYDAEKSGIIPRDKNFSKRRVLIQFHARNTT